MPDEAGVAVVTSPANKEEELAIKLEVSAGEAVEELICRAAVVVSGVDAVELD